MEPGPVGLSRPGSREEGTVAATRDQLIFVAKGVTASWSAPTRKIQADSQQP